MGQWGQGKLNTESPGFQCSYAGCAIGWFPKLVPKSKLKMQKSIGSCLVPTYQGKDELNAVATYFGILYRDANHLFMPDSYPDHDSNPSPEVVSQRILEFLKRNEGK